MHPAAAGYNPRPCPSPVPGACHATVTRVRRPGPRPGRPMPAAPGLPDRPPKWEYAELTFRATLDRKGGGTRGQRSRDPAAHADGDRPLGQWRGRSRGRGWAELAEKLKATGFKKDGSASYQKIQVLNFLGARLGVDGAIRLGDGPGPRTYRARVVRDVDVQAPRAVSRDCVFSPKDRRRPTSWQLMATAASAGLPGGRGRRSSRRSTGAPYPDRHGRSQPQSRGPTDTRGGCLPGRTRPAGARSGRPAGTGPRASLDALRTNSDGSRGDRCQSTNRSSPSRGRSSPEARNS